MGNKLAERLKQRIMGITVDPIVENGFDKIIDYLIDIGINILTQMKSEQAKERNKKETSQTKLQQKSNADTREKQEA